MRRFRNVFLPAHVVLFFLIVSQRSFAQGAPAKRPAKKVWTNDELQPRFPSEATPIQPKSSDTAKDDLAIKHYLRAKDSRWYVKQLGPLRAEIAHIDQQLKEITEAHKTGRRTTGAVALDQEPEGVSTDAQTVLLQKRRLVLMKKIDELESEASRNDISPGALRSDVEPEKSNAAEASDNSVPSGGPEIAEAEKSLRETKDDLKRLRKELDLLQRRLRLEEREVYSNPNYLSYRTGDSRLVSLQGEIAAKDRAIQEREQDVGQLEEHLEDLKLNWPTEVRSNKNSGGESNGPDSGSCRQTDAAIACTVNEKAQQEKDEGYWRKRFSEARYEINIAENERDILEGELGVLLLQYEPNPAKAMRESVTRKQITEHQKAIDDKKHEIAQLQLTLADLEDELRHAGGPPGWSRE
jgi:flagellar biosynthesis chaperone FliJ